MDPNQQKQSDPQQKDTQKVENASEASNRSSAPDPRFEQNSRSDETDSGIDLYREEHGDLTNDNT